MTFWGSTLLNRYLIWVAIFLLALLAYAKDKQLEAVQRKIEGVLILQQHENEMLDRRLKQLVEFMREKHP